MGRYLLFDHIGQGGMAQIFLARATTDVGAARTCVVKEILPVYAARKEFAEMLVAEAKLAAKLNHANVVQVFDLGREGDTLYIAMEYVEGFDLSAVLKRCSQKKVKLPPELAFHVVGEALQGLDYAHRAKDESGKPLGIVHRDVSPSNVLLSFEGEVKVCDFGIAHANAHGPQTDSEAIKGKAGYMSPEHARGEALDARADVFAAGILLWELLAGRKLYRSDGGPLLDQAKRAEIPPLPERGFPHEDELVALVKRALAPTPAERFATAHDMRVELDAWARKAAFVANPIRLGDWLREHFGEELLARRAARERAAKPIERAPAIIPKAQHTPSPPIVELAPPEERGPASLVAVDVSPPSLKPASDPKPSSPESSPPSDEPASSSRSPAAEDAALPAKVGGLPLWVWLVAAAILVFVVTFFVTRS
jgi:serine/threonine-protein kinase